MARNRAAALAAGGLLALAVLSAGCDRAARVETLSPERGRIVESFTEPARTRLAKAYRITMPVSGRIRRIDFEPGDTVEKGHELVAFVTLPLQKTLEEAQAAVAEFEAELQVKDYNKLEDIAAKETEATVEASEEALKAADEEIKAERVRAVRAKSTLDKQQKLFERKVSSEDDVEEAQLAADTANISLRKEEFNRAALRALITAIRLGPQAVKEYLARKRLERVIIVQKLNQAKTRLARAQHDLELAKIVSPIDGVVLERYEQGDAALPEGKDLLLLGNLAQLEVEADVLTQDALRLGKDSAVELQSAAGRETLHGKVRRIEPAGFTKLSSLGVEQQRVKVIVSLERRPPGLKVGYRLQARFITGSKPDALIVPRFSVLQAPDRSFYVFKLVDGRLVRQPVTIGLRSDLQLEILDGLTGRDTIVARPDTTLKHGAKVKVKRTTTAKAPTPATNSG